MVATLALIAAVPLLGGPLTFNCDMARAGGGRFDLRGTFDGERLRSNLAEWPGLSNATELQNGQMISVENVNHYYEWNGPSERGRLKVQMVEYSNQRAAVLTIVRHFSDGRHSADSLVGTGMCETRRGPAENSQ